MHTPTCLVTEELQLSQTFKVQNCRCPCSPYSLLDVAETSDHGSAAPTGLQDLTLEKNMSFLTFCFRAPFVNLVEMASKLKTRNVAKLRQRFMIPAVLASMLGCSLAQLELA